MSFVLPMLFAVIVYRLAVVMALYHLVVVVVVTRPVERVG